MSPQGEAALLTLAAEAKSWSREDWWRVIRQLIRARLS